jgi:hypothetical protein
VQKRLKTLGGAWPASDLHAQLAADVAEGVKWVPWLARALPLTGTSTAATPLQQRSLAWPPPLTLHPRLPLPAPAACRPEGGALSSEVEKQQIGFPLQFALLAERCAKSTWRNPLNFKGRLAQTIFLSLVFGLIFLRLGNDMKGVQSRSGSLFFLITQCERARAPAACLAHAPDACASTATPVRPAGDFFFCPLAPAAAARAPGAPSALRRAAPECPAPPAAVFGAVLGALTIFGGEKAVFKREYGSRMYGMPGYFLSRWVGDPRAEKKRAGSWTNSRVVCLGQGSGRAAAAAPLLPGSGPGCLDKRTGLHEPARRCAPPPPQLLILRLQVVRQPSHPHHLPAAHGGDLLLYDRVPAGEQPGLPRFARDVYPSALQIKPPLCYQPAGWRAEGRGDQAAAWAIHAAPAPAWRASAAAATRRPVRAAAPQVGSKFLWLALVFVLLETCGASIGIFTACVFSSLEVRACCPRLAGGSGGCCWPARAATRSPCSPCGPRPLWPFGTSGAAPHACGHPHTLQVALAVMPMLLLPLMVFGGFFVNTNSIPAYFSWIQYLSPMRYGFIAAAKNEFSGLQINCQPGQNCQPGITGGVSFRLGVRVLRRELAWCRPAA